MSMMVQGYGDVLVVSHPSRHPGELKLLMSVWLSPKQVIRFSRLQEGVGGLGFDYFLYFNTSRNEQRRVPHLRKRGTS